MKFYRYKLHEYASHDIDGELCAPLFPNPHLEVTEYDLIKETSKGYWIGYDIFNYGPLRGNAHWIPKQSKKRYAYPTKEEALENFIARTKRRKKILDWQSDVCRIGLNLAIVTKDKLKQESEIYGTEK